MKRIQAGRREGEMTQITSYSMDAFIDDARKTFADSDDARVQAYSIAKYMEKLLKKAVKMHMNYIKC